MIWRNSETINAPVEVVWRLATEVADWPTFITTVHSVERLDDGPLRVGSRARIKQPAQPLSLWTVTRLEAGHEFSWQTRRRGLTLTGTHRIDPAGAGSRNTLDLQMSGPLAPVLGPLLGPMMRRVLRTENACFKAEAEQRTPAAAGDLPGPAAV